MPRGEKPTASRGYRFDRDAFERQLSIRGLHGRCDELAERAGISRMTLSVARRGYSVSPVTARRIAEALESFPISEMLSTLLVKEAV